MSQPASSLIPGVQGSTGSRALSKISINTRVSSPMGTIGVVTDVMQFADGVGNWIMGSKRVLIMGVPAVNQASVGTSFAPPPFFPPGPMTVVQADPRQKSV